MKKKIEKFEELIAWQKARKLTSQIYRVTNEGHFARTLVLEIKCDGLLFLLHPTWLKDLNAEAFPSFSDFFPSRKVHAPN